MQSYKTCDFANDMTAINRIAISACKNVGVKSMIYLHGLPAGSYNAIDNNRADYLCVWGDRMKELCVNAGVNANKVIVMGNANILVKIPRHSSCFF